MLDSIRIAAVVTPRPGNGNGGITPPWLQKPPVIVLPVEPDETVVVSVRPERGTRVVIGESSIAVTEVLS
jgi:hypothetical protein